MNIKDIENFKNSFVATTTNYQTKEKKKFTLNDYIEKNRVIKGKLKPSNVSIKLKEPQQPNVTITLKEPEQPNVSITLKEPNVVNVEPQIVDLFYLKDNVSFTQQKYDLPNNITITNDTFNDFYEEIPEPDFANQMNEELKIGYSFPNNIDKNKARVENYKLIKEDIVAGAPKKPTKGIRKLKNNSLDNIPKEFKLTCLSGNDYDIGRYLKVNYYQNIKYPQFILKYYSPNFSSNVAGGANNENNENYYREYNAYNIFIDLLEYHTDNKLILEYNYEPNGEYKFIYQSSGNEEYDKNIEEEFRQNFKDFPTINKEDYFVLVYVKDTDTGIYRNHFGIDKEGYDMDNIDVFGYDRNGNYIGNSYDINGLNRFFFNEEGIDILGRSFENIQLNELQNYYKINNFENEFYEGGKVELINSSQINVPKDYCNYFVIRNKNKTFVPGVIDELEFRFGKYITEYIKKQGQPDKPIKKFNSNIGYIGFGKLLKYFNEKTSRGDFNCQIEETLCASISDKDIEKKDFENYRFILNKEHIYHYYMNNFIKYYLINENVKCIKKTKSKELEPSTYESYDYDIRFSHSLELEIDKERIPKDLLKYFDDYNKCFRYRKRYSFTKIDKETNQDIYRIDLTMIRMNKTPINALNKVNEDDYKLEYQMELELLQPNENEDYRLYNVNDIMSELIMYRVILDDNGYLLSNENRKNLLKFYKDTIGIKGNDFVAPKPEGFDKVKAKKIDNNYSITIKADGERHLLMVMPNEEQIQLPYMKKYARQIFLINNRMNFIPTGREINITQNLGYCLFDGEYLLDNNTFMIFDVLFYNGNDVRNKFLFEENGNCRFNDITNFDTLISSRIEDSQFLLNYLTDKMGKNELKKNTFNIQVKKHYIPKIENKSLIELYTELKQRIETGQEISNDGFILTKLDQEYPGNKDYAKSWRNVYKLKPKKQNTIDFMVDNFTIVEKNSTNFVKIKLNCSRFFEKKDTKSKDTRPQQVFEFTNFEVLPTETYDFKYDQITYMFIPNDLMKTIDDNLDIFDRSIIECSWQDLSNVYGQRHYYRYGWAPLRMRLDKIQLLLESNTIRGTANNINIAKNIWKELNEPEEEFENMLKGYFGVQLSKEVVKEFQAVREHHRNIKKNLLKEHNVDNCKLIDFTCGRGSDMRNWLELKIQNVIGLDLDYDSIYKEDKDGIYWRFYNDQKAEILQNYKYLFLNFNSATEIFLNDIISKIGSIEMILNEKKDCILHNKFFKNLRDNFSSQTYYLYFINSYIQSRKWNDENKFTFNTHNIENFKPFLIERFKNYGFEISKEKDTFNQLIMSNEQKFNIATNFFSIHYFFIDKRTIMTLLSNVSSVLKQNNYEKAGKWLITSMNGDKLLKYFHFNEFTINNIVENRIGNLIQIETNGMYNKNKYKIAEKIIFKGQQNVFTEIENLNCKEDMNLKYICLDILQSHLKNYEDNNENIFKDYIKYIYISRSIENIVTLLQSKSVVDKFDVNKYNSIIKELQDKYVKLFKKYRKDLSKDIEKTELENIYGIMFNLLNLITNIYDNEQKDFTIYSNVKRYYLRLFNEIYLNNNKNLAKKLSNINNISNKHIQLDEESQKIKINIECQDKLDSVDNDLICYMNIKQLLMNTIDDITLGNKIAVKVSSISNIPKPEPLVFDFCLKNYSKNFGLVCDPNISDNKQRYIEQLYHLDEEDENHISKNIFEDIMKEYFKVVFTGDLKKLNNAIPNKTKEFYTKNVLFDNDIKSYIFNQFNLQTKTEQLKSGLSPFSMIQYYLLMTISQNFKKENVIEKLKMLLNEMQFIQKIVVKDNINKFLDGYCELIYDVFMLCKDTQLIDIFNIIRKLEINSIQDISYEFREEYLKLYDKYDEEKTIGKQFEEANIYSYEDKDKNEYGLKEFSQCHSKYEFGKVYTTDIYNEKLYINSADGLMYQRFNMYGSKQSLISIQ